MVIQESLLSLFRGHVHNVLFICEFPEGFVMLNV